jgi:hypothetical protein
VISLAVAAAGWVLLVTRRLRRYPISTTFETPPNISVLAAVGVRRDGHHPVLSDRTRSLDRDL